MKILIVDDEPLVRRSLERAFQSKGFRVLTAEDGKIGLDLWRSTLPDVVMLDVLMPGMSGTQVLDELKGSWTCKVAMMSAYTGDEMLNFQDRYRIDLFLPKPFDDIFEVVDKISKLAGAI